MIWWSSLIILIHLYLTFHLQPKKRLVFSLSFSVAPSVPWPRIRAHSGKSFSICKKSETFHETFKISKLWMPRSELLCAPHHAKLSALLGPRPWHRHVTVAALAVERQETSLLAQGTHRLPSEFLWIWCSERNVSNASNWGRTLNQNRSVFVSKRQGMHCKDSQSAFYMYFKQRYPQTSLPCTERLDHPNGGWSVWHPCPGHGMKF